MPSLTIPMNPLADLTFVGMMKKLPVDWKQPSGDPDAKHYPDGFAPAERSTVPEPMCYMWAQSVNKYHTEASKDIGGKFKDFCHKACDNIKNAVDMWRLQAKVKDLKVMAVCAIGAPGCVDGPELKDMVPMTTWIGANDNEKAYIKAVSEGVSKCWKEWASKVIVPGLPWYPAFAAFPLASAAPMPNIPMPLITCPSPGMAKMTPTMLRDAMADALDGGVKDKDKDKQHLALFMAIGTAVAAAFMGWLPMQQIMLVMGKGPVPVYSPPYVPVGPVLAGDNIAAPGHFAV